MCTVYSVKRLSCDLSGFCVRDEEDDDDDEEPLAVLFGDLGRLSPTLALS